MRTSDPPQAAVRGQASLRHDPWRTGSGDCVGARM